MRDDKDPNEENELCDCNDCLDEKDPTRQRFGEWAGTGIMSNDVGLLP